MSNDHSRACRAHPISREEAEHFAALIEEEEDVERRELCLLLQNTVLYRGEGGSVLWHCVERLKGG